MACTSASGTGSAAPIGAWGILGRRLGAALILVGMLPASSPPARLDIGVDGLRSGQGVVRICVTRDAGHFPDCHSDPDARRVTVPAGQPVPEAAYDTVGALRDRILGGERPQVALLSAEAIGLLIQRGLVREDATQALGRTGVALATPAGRPLPDISTPEAFRAEILIMEMTFVAQGERPERIHKYGHTHLDDFLERADRFENEVIIASHFSTRMHPEQIQRIIEKRLPASLRGRLKIWL